MRQTDVSVLTASFLLSASSPDIKVLLLVLLVLVLLVVVLLLFTHDVNAIIHAMMYVSITPKYFDQTG